MKISFIGFGNMAQAIARTLRNNRDYQIFAASPSLAKGINDDGFHTDHDNLAIIKDADVIFLAVKPANLKTVLTQISPHLAPNCLLVSIAAGMSLSWLAQYCPTNQAIVRSMPNIPIAVQEGATPLIANDYVTNKQKYLIEQLFQASGLTTWVTKESDIDSLTALSGSGPAYVFLFMEAMINAAKKLGLDENLAHSFTLQTVLGAAHLAKNNTLELSALRKKVTSPSGTTAAALDILRQQGFEELIFQAMKAACERAQQLGS
ncbi:pyrroline-5-carboxylate reductase [Legionella donaldsonii]|uniref:pyrroline-5-carboxylate reductase n=1 Tax=Legionella donaldsonii TaxID=45060 RepID=UPI00399CDD0E